MSPNTDLVSTYGISNVRGIDVGDSMQKIEKKVFIRNVKNVISSKR